MSKIRIGIVGYGNLGKGAELAIQQNKDMELVGIFTRRHPESVHPLSSSTSVYSLESAKNMKDQIDVMLLCGGSSTDLPEQGPALAKDFNTIDSFDTHAKIPDYFSAVDQACREGKTTSIISVGWDPGLFSINRLYFESILPQGKTYTFWGKGVSQGHSDAVRRVKGVKHAIQYTIPIEAAMDRIRHGENPDLTAREKHLRACYVVPEKGANLDQITSDIQNMPNYFADYDTTVTFLSEADFQREHANMPHGGFVLHSGATNQHNQLIEYSLTLDSNPEFTASVLVTYARAVYRLSKEGVIGAKTVFDIAPAYLSPKSSEALRAELL